MNDLKVRAMTFTERSGRISFGYVAYDDDTECFDLYWDALPDSDLDFLKKAFEDAGHVLVDLFNWARTDRHGFYLDGDYKVWDDCPEIAELVDKFLNGELAEELNQEVLSAIPASPAVQATSEKALSPETDDAGEAKDRQSLG